MARRREIHDVVVDGDDARGVLLAVEGPGDVRAVVGRMPAQLDEVHVVTRRRRRGLAHDETALLGELRCVHERHRLVDDRTQHTLQDGQGEHSAVVVGDLALVGDLQRVDGAPRQRGEQPTEALGERHEGLHRRVGFGGREIHRERHELAPQREHDLLCDGLPGLVLCFHGGRAEMRRDDYGVELEQRRLGGGLGEEHVERSSGDATLAHRVSQGDFVDDAPARGVHDAQGRLGVGQQLGGDEPERVRRLGQMDGEEVDPRHQLLDGLDEVDAELARPLRADVGVVGDELHPERVGPLRDEHADATQADDAERLVVQLDTLPAGAVPFTGPEITICLGDVARLREQQRDGVLGRRQHVGLRRVDDHHASTRGRLDVDVVEADPRPTDHDELVGRLEHFRGDLRRAADHQCRGTADGVEELAR